METIMKLLGSDITNNILCTANGSAHKSIQVQAFEVIQAAMDGVDRPLTSDVLEQLLEVVNHTFDVCKKISINIELLQSNVARMAMYGITIGVPQFVLRLLANIETLTKSKYGHLTNDVLEQLLEVVNHTFDVCKKISINIELLQSNVARMATYGITIGVPQFVLRLLTNIETLTKSKYGHELHLAMHAIREKYTYNHMHNATSLQTILTELAGADGMRVLKNAPAPSAGMAHSVAGSVSFLHLMVDGDDSNSEYTKLVFDTTSTSKLLEEECKPRG